MNQREYRAACSAYRKHRRTVHAISMAAETAPSRDYPKEREQAKRDIQSLPVVARPKGFDTPQSMIYGTATPADVYHLSALRRAVVGAKRQLHRATFNKHPLMHVSDGERAQLREALAVARIRHRRYVSFLMQPVHLPGSACPQRRASDRRLAA